VFVENEEWAGLERRSTVRLSDTRTLIKMRKENTPPTAAYSMTNLFRPDLTYIAPELSSLIRESSPKARFSRKRQQLDRGDGADLQYDSSTLPARRRVLESRTASRNMCAPKNFVAPFSFTPSDAHTMCSIKRDSQSYKFLLSASTDKLKMVPNNIYAIFTTLKIRFINNGKGFLRVVHHVKVENNVEMVKAFRVVI
jgi:hypothetical protein